MIFETTRMKITNNFLIIILALFIMNTQAQETGFYELSAIKINGDTLNFSELQGKKILIVNTASKCGLTPQYEELQELYDEYGGDNFIIIGFPANNFMKQEPGTNEEIKEFCTVNYGVTFQMMSKISVKGEDMHSVYQWLTQKENNGVLDSKISWNFQKYLIDESGNFIEMIRPKVSPLSELIIAWLSEENTD